MADGGSWPVEVDQEPAAYQATLTDVRGDKLIRERYEDGKRIISVDTDEEFGQVLHEIDNYRVEIEAPKEIMEAFGIFDSAEELGVDPDDEGLPPRRTTEAGGMELKDSSLGGSLMKLVFRN